MIKFKYWSAAALAALMSACSGSDFGGGDEANGSIRLQLSVDALPVGNRASRAELGDLTGEDLKLRLTTSDGSVREWTGLSEFEKEEKFPIGDYKLEALYGQEKDCGFDKPYIYGTAQVSVKHNQTTPVSLEAKLANSMVSVSYSEHVRKVFSTYMVTLTSDAGNPVEYPEDVRPVYVTPGNIQMRMSYTTGLSDEHNVPITEFKAEPQHHYRINIDINDGEIGERTMTISFDDSMTEHEIEIPLDGLSKPSGPVMSVGGFVRDKEIEVVAGVERTEDLFCGIVARGGLKTVTLKTEGASLIDNAWPAEIDLLSVKDDAQRQTYLTSHGLNVRGLWGNQSDAMADMVVIDFKDIIAHIPDATEGKIKFSVSVSDKYDQPGDATINLPLNVSRFRLELSDVPSEVWELEDAFAMTLTYNGGNPTEKLRLMEYNERGIESPIRATFTPVAGSANQYTVNVDPRQPWRDDFKLFVKEEEGKMRKSDEHLINYVKVPVISFPDANIWATKAYVTIHDGNDPSAYYGSEELAYSINGVDFNLKMKPVGKQNLMLIEGLTPGTKYEITARNPKDPDNVNRTLRKITFTTEKDAQLPNAGMEDWCQTAGESHWELIYPGKTAESSAWGTNNPMTTSQGANYAYCRISGTISSDGRTGKCALIRTVGWGSGNTATGSGGNSGETKYTDAGLLHLGASRTVRPSGFGDREGTLDTDDLDCGIAFTSRPQSMSFWYKYQPKNSSDKGRALIRVIGPNGNVIAENDITLDKADAFTQITVDLSSKYALQSANAAKIYVRFLSCINRDYLKKSNANFSGPGFANLSRGTYMGSQLWIDDITLNY